MTSAPRLENRLDALEPPYKSRGEIQVGRLLDLYGIHCFYEQPTLIYDRGRHRLWRPDYQPVAKLWHRRLAGGFHGQKRRFRNAVFPFTTGCYTLPTFNGLIIEYAGMMDIPDYAAGIRHKRQAYEANGIPAMLVYPQDLRKPGWPERVVESIYEAADRSSSPSLPHTERSATGGYR
ncbi:MAG: hypothetical protein JXQ75_08845 [Phycisphaerae bacterium]|nr:hypothetical protein [Phycisphaerae bacterium]